MIVTVTSKEAALCVAVYSAQGGRCGKSVTCCFRVRVVKQIVKLESITFLLAEAKYPMPRVKEGRIYLAHTL